MGKQRFTENEWRRNPWFRQLCQAFLACETEADVANFFRDVGTLSELQAWSERYEVARELSRGLTYREAAQSTKASTTTVSRVAAFLRNGTGGYRRVLSVLEKTSHHPRQNSRGEKMALMRSQKHR